MNRLKAKDWMVILSFIAIAVGALYVAELLKNELIKSLCRELSSLVGITGILSVMLRRRDYNEILDSVLGVASLSKNIKDTGLFCVSPSFRDLNYRDEINQSVESIDICIIYSSSWIKANFSALLEFSKHKNAKIRICFLDPKSTATAALDEKFKIANENNLTNRIQESIDFMRKNFSTLSDEKIEIYIQPYIPQYSMYRFDNRIFVTPYFLSPGRFEVPVFGFKCLDSGRGLFTSFLADFERLIQSSERLSK